MYVAKDYNPEYIKNSHKRKINIPIENQAKCLSRHLTRDNIQMANEHLKKGTQLQYSLGKCKL